MKIQRGASRREEGGMGVDFDKVLPRAVEAARRVDGIAVTVAFAAAVLLIFALGVHFLLSLLLALGIYAGIVLLRPQPGQNVAALTVPPTPEEEAFQAARASSANIAAAIPQLASAKVKIPQTAKASIRKGVTRIVHEIDRMLDVMEEDEKYIAAPLYYGRLVQPFEQLWFKELRMWLRDVAMPAFSYQDFETEVLPRFERAAKEFYQQYHQSDVIDLAVLREILMDNLASITDETDQDADDDMPDQRSAGGGQR
jgi:hypothetical protein